MQSALGLGVINCETFTKQVKETLTTFIREHQYGDRTFSTTGLPRNKARKKIMDTYHLIKNAVVIDTVREFSQDDRVVIATYIILVWYQKCNVCKPV